MKFESIHQTLNELKNLISQLNVEDYCKRIDNLSGATIGEHSRHIIELFQCVLQGYQNGTINYDKRERNILIQNNPKTAYLNINAILEEIVKPNKNLLLEQRMLQEDIYIETNYYREMLYNLEHCIHHQALIKVAILEMHYINVNTNFGVAPSTIEYRKECAQ